MRRFIDTNIFVYSFDARAPDQRRRAQEIIGEALAEGTGVCSSQVVQEFVNVALRRFAKPMTHAQVRTYLREVLLPLCATFPAPEAFEDALLLCERHSLSWYDSLIVAAAVTLECDELCTEDLQDGLRIGGLTVRDPFR